MPIVTVSRGSYTRGTKVAEELAEKMGYECISREILIEASQLFNISEIKLERALHDAPSVLNRFSYGKEKYLSYIRVAILRHMVNDNVIYHGLGGHVFLSGVKHLLKVRIRADFENRVNEEMKRSNISIQEARQILQKDDDERRKWNVYITGVDPCDASHYHMVFNASKIPVDEIVDMISQILSRPYIQNTPESQSYLKDLLLAAEVKAALVESHPKTYVTSENGTVIVRTEGSLEREQALSDNIKKSIPEFSELKEVRVHVVPSIWQP
ncbi:MAG TPA: cytidylate kinase-like family protein [Desulfohalobiaceae bacterium]|nr:cytidylate kinase-like family protein [Desulfohalobiaceae bacterium]